MIMEKFAPPEWVEVKDKILYERTITVKDGVEQLFSMIPSDKKNEIIDFVKKNVKLRDGFESFLDFCKREKIDFNVISAGLDFFIETVLKDFKDKLQIFCNVANFDSPKIQIEYKHLPKNCTLCGECGLCKIEVIESYPKDRFIRVMIGDSLSDLQAAKVADITFARAGLIKYLEQEKIPFIPFKDFYEVKEQLVQKYLIKT